MSLTVLGLLLFGAGYFLKREHSTKVRVHQEQVDLQRAKEEDQQTKEKEQKAIGKMGQGQGWASAEVVLRGTSWQGHSL